MSAGLVAAKEGPYPNRPIEVVLPFDPGGVMDISSRIIVEEMSRELKVPLVVVNLPGAGGMTGAVNVLKARSDGYTLLSTSTATMISTPCNHPIRLTSLSGIF